MFIISNICSTGGTKSLENKKLHCISIPKCGAKILMSCPGVQCVKRDSATSELKKKNKTKTLQSSPPEELAVGFD